MLSSVSTDLTWRTFANFSHPFKSRLLIQVINTSKRLLSHRKLLKMKPVSWTRLFVDQRLSVRNGGYRTFYARNYLRQLILTERTT